MPKHPAQEAWGQGDIPTGTASGPDIANATETYTPFVALSVSDITTRNLERTKHVVLIEGNSIKFFKHDPANTDLEDGDTVIWDSEDRPFVLVQRGDRYDLAFSTTGLLSDGEVMPAYAIPTPIMLPAGLPGSLAFCMDVPTAETVITFEMSTNNGEAWSAVFTVTFAEGSRIGAFSLPAAVTLAAGTLLRAKGPATADVTFAGFTATVVATRSTS